LNICKDVLLSQKQFLENFILKTFNIFTNDIFCVKTAKVDHLGKMKSNENEKYVVEELLVQVHSLKGGAPDGVSSGVFPNVGRMHKY
jgi:hypothetical protein